MNTNPKGSVEQRFWQNVDASGGVSGCWPWLGYHDDKGYGQIHAGTTLRAHRLSLAIAGIVVPPSALVLHSCDNPPCVNPAHLRVGTQSDNRRDMISRNRHPAILRRRLHCKRGHEMTDANSLHGRDGHRQCRICRVASRAHTRFAASAEAFSTEPVAPAPSLAGMDASAESPRGARAGSGGAVE